MTRMGDKLGIQCVTCAGWYPDVYAARVHEIELHEGRTASYTLVDDESLRCNCAGIYKHSTSCPAGIQESMYEPYRRRAKAIDKGVTRT